MLLILSVFFPTLALLFALFYFVKAMTEVPSDIAKIIVFFIKKWQDILLYIALIIGGFLLVVAYHFWKSL